MSNQLSEGRTGTGVTAKRVKMRLKTNDAKDFTRKSKRSKR